MTTRIYAPFGELAKWAGTGSTGLPSDDKGFIRERHDADAGLQYLNARYYDTRLGLFVQPDWFEVTLAGVGTNRYSYSFNDPVNKLDPSGNSWEPDGTDYGVTLKDGTQIFGPSGFGVGGASAAQSGNPIIQSIFASGSQFAGMSDDVNTRTQANAYAASGQTSREMSRSENASISGLGNLYSIGSMAIPAAPIYGSLSVFGKGIVASRNTSRYFWSGTTASGESVKLAARNAAVGDGAVTLEMTHLGILGATVVNHLPRSVSNIYWRGISHWFANGARGKAKVVLGQRVNMRGTWVTREKPTLIKNGILIVEQTIR